MMRYEIQPEKDLNRQANAAGDDIGTNFILCAEEEAEHFAVYRSESGKMGDFELAEDFADRWLAEAYIALCQIRDIDNRLNAEELPPTGDTYNEVLSLALDILKTKERP